MCGRATKAIAASRADLLVLQSGSLRAIVTRITYPLRCVESLLGAVPSRLANDAVLRLFRALRIKISTNRAFLWV